MPGARRQLKEGIAAALEAAGFAATGVTSLSTSRRLIVAVSGLPDRQDDREEAVLGPPARVAFDADGAPTRAAEGFARKLGLEPSALKRMDTAKGEYVGAIVRREGRPAGEILGEAIPAVVGGLRFPKIMRWGVGTWTFVRPVHGVVALFGERTIDLELFGLSAGRETVGHRVHAPGRIDVGGCSEYAHELEARRVIVDPKHRRRMLEERAAELAAEVGCRVHPDPELVAEHVELVEYPGLIRGSIAERFLELPPEVVVTTLRHHQKCLILETDSGALAPYFLAVIDRADDPVELNRQGNEWVIGARLADAGFFFAEDRKRTLDDLVPELDRLELHRKLGSLGDKARRVGPLAAWLAAAVGSPADPPALERAAALVKADLVTHMVGEFPELQGVMGGHYLRLAGEPEEVWTAARDHYTPIGFEGELPASETGRLIGAADRLDTLAALFAVGEIPPGSRDPFGLRRAAQAVVKIIAESGWNLELGEALRRAAAATVELGEVGEDALVGQLSEFMSDRVRRYLTDVIGVSGDTADAVMAAGWQVLPGLVERAGALERVRSRPEFRALALAFKRVRNITEGQPEGGVNPALFADPAEADLFREAEAFHTTLVGERAAGRVDGAFAAMGRLAEVLDRFFIDVLVMSEDLNVRANRIALLKKLGRDFLTLADLSRLRVEGDQQ